jgi:hypothetical protein
VKPETLDVWGYIPGAEGLDPVSVQFVNTLWYNFIVFIIKSVNGQNILNIIFKIFEKFN